VKLLSKIWQFILKILGFLAPRAAHGLTAIYIESIDNMERYKLKWVPSVSSFANSQYALVKVDGGVEQPSDVQNMNVSSLIYAFPTGAAISWRVKTVDDTGSKEAFSAVHTFTAENLEPLAEATGLNVEYLGHIPD